MTAPEHGLTRLHAVAMFAAFALAYFLSALLRAITATLAPVFSLEMGLSASGLGLLAGIYFVGFAATQLPLGGALDRFGPKRVLLALLLVAVSGCGLFALAEQFSHLLFARLLIGIGVSACLMAPLTAYRRHLSGTAQLRANSWMLMMGSLGMLASTLPVQWLLPWSGWRGLFWLLSVMVMVVLVPLAWLVPSDQPRGAHGASDIGYGRIWRDATFRRLAPMGFCLYGGLIAMQSLWIGPWLTEVAGESATGSAAGLLAVNAGMLLAFLVWGAVVLRLTLLGWPPLRLITVGWPLSVATLGVVVILGPAAGAISWTIWCVAASVVTLSQPAVGLAFPQAHAGRALSAFNLVVFLGVFATQWGIGLMIDGLQSIGWTRLAAYQAAFTAVGAGMAGSGVWYWLRPKACPYRAPG